MLLAFLRPSVLNGAKGDDQVLKRVPRYRDATEAAGQLQALTSYGMQAKWTENTSFQSLEAEISAGIPVPCGYLHHDPAEQPAGSGHWLIVMGQTPTQLIVHDLHREADLVSEATIGGPGPFCRYSHRN
jgi:hypothetical protein